MQYENWKNFPKDEKNFSWFSMWKILSSCPERERECFKFKLATWMDFRRTFHLILIIIIVSILQEMKQVHSSILNSITGSWWDSRFEKIPKDVKFWNFSHFDRRNERKMSFLIQFRSSIEMATNFLTLFLPHFSCLSL